MGSPATSTQRPGPGTTKIPAGSQAWEGEQSIIECKGEKKGQGLVPTLPVFKGDCCPEEKKRKPGTAQFFSLGLVPLLSMHYPGCWKLIIKKIRFIPATCFLLFACGIEYLTHTFEHQAGCDTSLCMQLAPLQVTLMPDVSLNMTQEIMLVFAKSSYFFLGNGT